MSDTKQTLDPHDRPAALLVERLDSFADRVQTLEKLNEHRWQGLNGAVERWATKYESFAERVEDIAATCGSAVAAGDALCAVLLAIISAEVHAPSRRAMATRIAAKLEEAASVPGLFPPLIEKLRELAAHARVLAIVTRK
jgi:hypothetical protein